MRGAAARRNTSRRAASGLRIAPIAACSSSLSAENQHLGLAPIRSREDRRGCGSARTRMEVKMGDKSPKAKSRQTNQHQAKNDAAAKQKQKAISAKQVPKKG